MAQGHARRSGQQVQPVIAIAARQRRGRSHCVHTVAPLRRPRYRSACDEKGRPARRLSRSMPCRRAGRTEQKGGAAGIAGQCTALTGSSPMAAELSALSPRFLTVPRNELWYLVCCHRNCGMPGRTMRGRRTMGQSQTPGRDESIWVYGRVTVITCHRNRNRNRNRNHRNQVSFSCRRSRIAVEAKALQLIAPYFYIET
jgi:hypothetical protein